MADFPDKILNWTYLVNLAIAKGVNPKSSDYVTLIGIRYFYNNFHDQRGVYDDAMFVVSELAEEFIGRPCNTEGQRFGKNSCGSYAKLMPGKWEYKLGTHGASHGNPKRNCWRQNAPVRISRDSYKSGNKCLPTKYTTGQYYINIHPGANGSVSSLGCQTFRPNHWKEFQAGFLTVAKRKNTNKAMYVLIEKFVGPETFWPGKSKPLTSGGGYCGVDGLQNSADYSGSTTVEKGKYTGGTVTGGSDGSGGTASGGYINGAESGSGTGFSSYQSQDKTLFEFYMEINKNLTTGEKVASIPQTENQTSAGSSKENDYCEVTTVSDSKMSVDTMSINKELSSDKKE